MLTGLLNRVIEFEEKTDTKGDFGSITSEWVFFKRTKASVTVNAVNNSYSENTGEVVNYITTFITRYDRNITYAHRIQYNNNYYKIRTIQEMGRKEGLMIKCDLIEGNRYE
jgi:SPP1 family predicted phage head-tail adaptor